MMESSMFAIQSITAGFKLYRWPTANTNDPSFSVAPVVAFTNVLTPTARWGRRWNVRGSGTNTQIILGCGSSGAGIVTLLTSSFLLQQMGTNFTALLPSDFRASSNAVFNDGIAFGPGGGKNTFFCKAGWPARLLFLAEL